MDEQQRRLVAIAGCCLLATLGWHLATVAAIVALMGFVVFSQACERRRLSAALRRLETFTAPGPAARRPGDVAARFEHVADVLEETALRDPERMLQRHAATGVSTREPLIARMKVEGSGMLGIVRFADYDRLSAFDPALGTQLLVEATARLKAMLPASRMLAHVDRGHLAIWFGPEIDEAGAQVEIDAIVYALGEALPMGGRPVLPEVAVRLARLVDDDPSTLLARTVARLSVPDGEPGRTGDTATAAKDRFALEQDLRQALSAGELQLRFQPLVHAGEGRVHGAEALIRWRHPQHGMIAPSHFIPMLESAGLAHEIGLWAINTACREARAWQAAGLDDLRIAVNVSAYQIEREDLPTLIARTLERHGLAPEAFEIELTESAALVDSDHARKLFAQLRDLGVRIAIDDFGTGFSSLSTLRSLAFDKIKIDREFVTEVEQRRESQAICQSIIALARGLGIGVLAEGVERFEEYAWLRRHGCDKFQGYFFSPPLESAAFVAFAQDRQGLAAKFALDPRALQNTIVERLSA